MSKIERGNIHQIIIDIVENQDIEFLLIISYEFDPNQFFNLFEADETKKIDIIQRIKPIVIFDAKNTSPEMQNAKWVECYTQNKNYSCHHSKAYCIITTNNEVHLILGSANFTESGLFKNREVLEYFQWSKEKTKHINILQEWIDFLELYSFNQPNTKQESRFSLFYKKLKNCCEQIKPKQSISSKNNEYFLIHSGYNSNGLEKLKQICKNINIEPTTLYLVSPFFDTNSNKNICNDFKKSFNTLKEIHICTDTNEKKELTICKNHFDDITKTNQNFYLISPKINGNEYDHIKNINESTVKQENIKRNLHAKILILSNGKKEICYIGSANFTQNAWLGKNNELGIVEMVNKPQELWQEILTGLYAEKNNKDRVTFSSSPENEDDIDEKRNFFPDFIDYIELKPKGTTDQNWIDNNDILNFILHINKEKLTKDKSIEHYRVTWKDAEIKFKLKNNCLISKEIKNDTWTNLLLNDSCTLCFKRKNNDNEYYIPFNYDKQILAQPELIEQKSSYDILLSMAGYTKTNDDNTSEDNTAREGKQKYTHDEQKEIRNANPIIEMQQYLKLFGEVENTICDRIKNKKTPEAIINELEKISELARAIYQEYQPENKNEEATLFKLGEIYYFIKIQDKFTPHSKQTLKKIKKLIEQIQANTEIETNYKNFIFRKII